MSVCPQTHTLPNPANISFENMEYLLKLYTTVNFVFLAFVVVAFAVSNTNRDNFYTNLHNVQTTFIAANIRRK
jgi:hypothetical protein